MSKIERTIRRACPEFLIDSIENLGEGDFCRAFLVNKNLVVRFARHEEARQSLRRESCLLPQIIGKITLQIPAPRFSSLDPERADRSFIAYEFLPDKALTQAEYLKLGDASRTLCAAQVAGFLNEIHSIPIDMAEKCGVLPVDYNEKYSVLLKNVREILPARLETADFEFAENEILKFLESAEAADHQPVLLHGDLSPDHVLFDGKRVTSIIDFGDLMVGDAAWDFLWIYEDYGLDFFERAVSHYAVDDKSKLTARVRQFSVIEGIQWIADCLTGDENILAEAVENLQTLRDNRGEII